MKRLILGSLVAATCFAGSAAMADDDTGAWYVAPMLQYNLLDDKRAAKDDFGFDVALGVNLAPHFATEFNYSNGSYRIHGGQPEFGFPVAFMPHPSAMSVGIDRHGA